MKSNLAGHNYEEDFQNLVEVVENPECLSYMDRQG